MSDLDAAERRAVLDEWQRQSAVPLPADWRSGGCAVAILGGAAGVAAPTLLRWLGIDLPAVVRVAMLAAVGVAVLGGLSLHLFGGVKRATVLDAQVEEAVRVLTSGSTDQTNQRTAAVSLLLRAYESTGPATRAQYDAAAMAARLGSALDGVRRIERILAQQLPGFWRVFTADEPPHS